MSTTEHEHTGKCEQCGIELNVKPKRKKFEGEERRQRRTISIKVPNDQEDGGAIWDETLRDVKAALVGLGLYDNPEKIPAYEALIAALRDWLNDLIFPDNTHGDSFE